MQKKDIIALLKKEITESKKYEDSAKEYSLKEYFNGKRFAYEHVYENLYPEESFTFYMKTHNIQS